MFRLLFFFNFLLSLVTPYYAFAVEEFPEYKVGIEKNTIYQFLLFTDESFQSDKQTYSRDWQDRTLILRSPKILDSAHASLNVETFDQQNILKLNADVGEKTRFQFLYLEDRDLETAQQLIALEIFLSLSDYSKLSVYALPNSRKALNDFGLSLNFDLSDRHHLRLYSTFIDLVDVIVNRVDVNTKISGIPFAAGFVGRIHSNSTAEQEPLSRKQGYWEYSLKGERKTYSSFSLPRKEWRVLANSHGLLELGDSHALGLALQFKRHFSRLESQDLQSSQNHYWIKAEHVIDPFMSRANWFFRWGLVHSLREAISNNIGPARRRDNIPYFWWGFDLGGEKTLQAGADYTRFNLDGGEVLKSREVNTARINLRYDIHYLNYRSLLGFLASFSLPIDNPMQWMGGKIHFQMQF